MRVLPARGGVLTVFTPERGMPGAGAVVRVGTWLSIMT